MKISAFRSPFAGLLAAAFAALLIWPSTAAARPEAPRARAKQCVIDGLAAQQRGELDEAIALYQEAYALVPHPELLFNLGQTHRLKGERERALDYYRQYLERDVKGRAAKDAGAWIQKLERELEAQRAAEQAAAERIAEQAAAIRTAEQAAADRVAEQAAARAAERSAREAAVRRARQPAAQRQVTAERDDDRRDRGLGARRKLALGFGGVALASLGTAAYFELAARDALDEHRAAPRGSAGQRRYDDANRQHHLAQGLAIGGGALVALATTLWLTAPARQPARQLRASSVLSPTMAGLAVSGAF